MALRNGQVQILVATDVARAARRADHHHPRLNYGLPMKAEDYTHRIGRTDYVPAARAWLSRWPSSATVARSARSRPTASRSSRLRRFRLETQEAGLRVQRPPSGRPWHGRGGPRGGRGGDRGGWGRNDGSFGGFGNSAGRGGERRGEFRPEARGEFRAEPRGDVRFEPRGDFRPEGRGEFRGAERGEFRGEQRGFGGREQREPRAPQGGFDRGGQQRRESFRPSAGRAQLRRPPGLRAS